MIEQRLTLCQGSLATWFFLRWLCQDNPKKNLKNEVGLEVFMRFIGRNFDLDFEWRRCYASVIKKDWDPQGTLSGEQAFLILEELVSRYSKKYGFDLAEVSHVLSLMRQHPEDCQIEKEQWKKAVSSALETKANE